MLFDVAADLYYRMVLCRMHMLAVKKRWFYAVKMLPQIQGVN